MEKNMPVFSIVVPVYNTVNELRRCTDSILQQNFCDFEVLLVDDGSKDGSGELCDQIAAEDNRVIPLHKENGGCADARNYGTKHAKGQYIIYLDSDDKWRGKTALRDLHRIIKNNPGLDVVCFGVRIIGDNGKTVKIRRVEAAPYDTCDKKDVLKPLVYTNQYFCTSYVKCLRTEFVRENNLYFIKGLLSEDIEWSARILVHCKSIAVYPKVFYDRIVRTEGSITASIGKKNITDILGSIEKGIVHTKENSENPYMLSLYYEYWAYQYAMLYSLVSKVKKDPEYGDIISRIKALKWLLKYDHVKKVRLVHAIVLTCGVKAAVLLTGIYYRLTYK